MVGLIICLSILVLLICLLISRIGVSVKFFDSDLKVVARFGLFRIKVYPQKKKKPAQAKVSKPKRDKVKKPKEKPEKPGRTIGFDEIMAFAKVGFRAADRFLRGLRFDRLFVTVVVATSDPVSTAKLYGYSAAGVSIVFPMMKNYFKIRKKHISLDMDFSASKIKASLDIEISIVIWRIFAIAFSSGFRALMIYLHAPKKNLNAKGGLKNG